MDTGLNSRVWDAGLQPERTALAWQRTALGSAAAALGTARLAVHHSAVPALLVASISLIVAAATILRVRRRYARSVHRLAGGHAIAALGPALLSTVSIALLGCAAILLIQW